MTVHIKLNIGAMFQNAMVIDGQQYVDDFDFTMENMNKKIAEYCNTHPTVSEIVLYGTEKILTKFKHDIESKGLVNYANKPIQVTIKGE